MTSMLRTVDERELLEHLGWVRGLARQLLGCPHDAEDLAQDVCQTALENPPRATGGGGMRAWLRSVTRLRARHTLRSRRNRSAREAAVAGGEAITDDVVKRNALVQKVSAAVMALPEPYRSTVLYRYFDGLTPAQIAARMGVPGTTARKRLSRGLSMLRGKLSEGGITDAGLEALIVLPAPGLLGAKLASTGAVVALAKPKMVVGLLALGSVGLAYEAWGGALPGSAADRASPPAPDVVASARPQLPPLAAGPGATPSVGAVDPGTTGPGARLTDARRQLPQPADGAQDVPRPGGGGAGGQGNDEVIYFGQDSNGEPVILDTERLARGLVEGLAEAAEEAADEEEKLPDGYRIETHANGARSAAGTVTDGRREGAWTEWHASGDRSAEGSYALGKRHGTWTYWHVGGEVSAVGDFLYGNKEGLWTRYAETGDRIATTTWRGGRQHGVARTWYPGGGLRAEVRWSGGAREGTATTWYGSGRLESRGQYDDGEPVGSWQHWREDGTVDTERTGTVPTRSGKSK